MKRVAIALLAITGCGSVSNSTIDGSYDIESSDLIRSVDLVSDQMLAVDLRGQDMVSFCKPNQSSCPAGTESQCCTGNCGTIQGSTYPACCIPRFHTDHCTSDGDCCVVTGATTTCNSGMCSSCFPTGGACSVNADCCAVPGAVEQQCLSFTTGKICCYRTSVGGQDICM